MGQRVEVSAIEINNIFVGEEGRNWLKLLANYDNIDIFYLLVVQAIVLSQWKYFKQAIIRRMLFPFLAYLFLFVLYTSLFLPYKATEDGWGPWSMSLFVLSILLLLLASYMAYIEVM